MNRLTAISLLMTLLILSLADSAQSAVQLYTGRMDIIVTSGKSCEGLSSGINDVSLAFTEEGGSGGVLNGYFTGGGITIGKFSGKDPAHLDVRYPFQEEERATGHYISLARSNNNNTLAAELHDRHVDATADDCNFDLARMNLTRSADGDAAARLAQMAGLFDAQLTHSQAVALAQSNGYATALPYFEKALKLADTYLPKGSEQINAYVIGLATSYIWLGRLDDFNKLFDTRIITIHDETVRSIFSEYRVRTLLNAGREAMTRGENDAAQKLFEQAYKLAPQNKEVIAAVMSDYVRSGHYTEAISFLERSESMLTSEADRKDIHAATAIVLFKKAQKEDKDGNDPEAERSLKRAMELDPDSVMYLIALARLRHKAGSLAEAEKLLDQGMKRFSDLPSQNAIAAARDRMRLTEMFLKKLRSAGK
ncbi:MAG: hypothetical protein M0T70_11260 [Geobacteraceae bacterium]|nr:hypothetical protein [Geobacteraceae bacterium]